MDVKRLTAPSLEDNPAEYHGDTVNPIPNPQAQPILGKTIAWIPMVGHLHQTYQIENVHRGPPGATVNGLRRPFPKHAFFAEVEFEPALQPAVFPHGKRARIVSKDGFTKYEPVFLIIRYMIG